MHLCVLTGFPQARENAAERKRSRSEADTGRRTEASCGLCSCLFFGRENRFRFSRRAGPSRGLWIGLYFGLDLELYLGRERIAKSPCQRSARSPRMRRGRTVSFTGRLSLNVRSLLAAAENKPGRLVMNWATGRPRQNWAEPLVVLWALLLAGLLRLFEPRSSPPRGGLQLVGARCIHRWRQIALTRRAEDECHRIGPSFCDPTGRAGRSLPPRRPATDVAVGPAGFGRQCQTKKVG